MLASSEVQGQLKDKTIIMKQEHRAVIAQRLKAEDFYTDFDARVADEVVAVGAPHDLPAPLHPRIVGMQALVYKANRNHVINMENKHVENK